MKVPDNPSESLRRLNPHLFGTRPPPVEQVFDRLPRRTNAGRDGREWEWLVAEAAARYERDGVLRLRKVTPPARVVGGGKDRKVVFLDNPFLDFVGVWSARGGRALLCECKDTSGDRLRLGDGGLTDKQADALWQWHRSGAAAFVLWRAHSGVCLIPAWEVAASASGGAKSVEFPCGFVVAQADPLRFLPALEAAYP